MKSLISRNPKVQFGDYCIRGTRIQVWAIKEDYRAGSSVGVIANGYGLSELQVKAAIAFRGGNTQSRRQPMDRDQVRGENE